MKVTAPLPEYRLMAPKEAVIAWNHNAVTLQVMEIVRAEIESSCRRTLSGEILGENVAQNVARAVGYIEGLQFLTETIKEVTDFIEDIEDVTDKRKENSQAVR